MTGSYTIAAISAPLLVVLLEVAVLRTGILRRGRFWLTLAIVLGFQVLVDGWLTKLSAPVVRYQPQASSGVRWPWDIPVEDYGFGFAMVTLTLMLWTRARVPRLPENLAPKRSGRAMNTGFTACSKSSSPTSPSAVCAGRPRVARRAVA